MNSSSFYNALIRPPNQRSDEDLCVIFNHLRRLEVFEKLTDGPLRSVCKTARLERHPANYVLFRKGSLAYCWYILLYGSVFMNKQIYLPIGCFGKRSAGMNLRRMSDCIVISPSEMIVIDYPDVQRITVHLNNNEQPPAAEIGSSFAAYQHRLPSHPHHPSSSSAAAQFLSPNSMPSCSSSSSPIVTDHSHLTRRRSSGEEMAQTDHRFQHHNPLHHHHHQQPLVFHHRYPASPPPPMLASPHPHLNRNHPPLLPTNNSIQVRQHQPRIPSPAPTTSLSSSPIKQHHLITPIPVGNHLQPTNHYHHHHTKSNSLSEETHNHYNVQPQQFSRQKPAQWKTDQHSHQESHQHENKHQKPAVNRIASHLQMMVDSGNIVQQKNDILETKSSSNDTSTLRKRSPNPPVSRSEIETKTTAIKNSNNTTASSSIDDKTEKKRDHSPNQNSNNSKNAMLSSNFQRLSRMRLNMAKKLHPSTSSSLSSSDLSQNTVNVRIRHQSPQPLKLTRRIRPSTPSSISSNQPHGITVTGDEADCFAGLPETVVDSEGPEGEDDDEEEDEDEEGSCPSHDSVQELRDNVRECLERPPEQRSDEDIAVLIDFLDSLPTLATLPMAVKRQLSLKMVFAHVPNKGTVIMQNGERIDAWSVVVNGCVEQIRSNGQRTEYRIGDCFGVKPTANPQFNDGEIRTLSNDCEFILVEHSEFHSIMSTVVRQIEQEQDKSGEMVREVERRMVDNQIELLITKASPDRLVQQLLVDDESTGGGELQMDSHFVEDFLLMHRIFLRDSSQIVRQLIDWFRTEPKYRDRVARIMMIWLNNHFEDFEDDETNNKEMSKMLDEFDGMLADAKMFNHQSLLSITVSVKSQPRMITLTRSDRKEKLDFQLIGGHNGIFVLSINPNSAAEKAGIKKWDEILEVNGQNCRRIPIEKVMELLRESTHLSMCLKTNWMGFKEALVRQGDQTDSCTPHPPSATLRATNSASPQSAAMSSRYQKKSSVPMIGIAGCAPQPIQQQRERRSTLCSALQQQAEYEQRVQGGANHIAGTATPGSTESNGGTTLSSKKVLNKLLHMIRGGNSTTSPYQMVDSADELSMLPSTSGGGGSLRASRSNPDISVHSIQPFASCSSSTSSNRHSSLCTNNCGTAPGIGNFGFSAADHVLKVYRADQSFRYILISPEITARQLLHLALQEFGFSSTENESWWALYECSVSREGVTKQRRLPDTASNLAERVGLNARLYLRDMQRAEESNLLPDEVVPELLKQTRFSLYALNAQCIAAQLTLQDFAIFASIKPTEYVNNLFQLNENPCTNTQQHRGWPKLESFETLFNREMWWVATEICCERNVYRRSKLVKKFIKIARHCHLLRNLNSMFAIVSGLEKPAVRRLLHTWERVPGKYLKMLADLQQLMDPSRNMSRYRQLLVQLVQDPPVIPIYPILRKDLIFAHEANSTFCAAKLVNFEKLRMIAQIIRNIQRYSSVPYEPAELIGAHLFDSAKSGINQSGRFGTSGGVPSRKKLYERSLMLRRVKEYLQAMPIIDSEIDLDRISLECEPPMSSSGATGTSSQQLFHQHGSSTPSRRRLPSPSPSSLSSQSNKSSTLQQHRGMINLPKFGVESPQAVQKMLSLVHNSKIKSRPPGHGRIIHSKDDLPPTGFDSHQQSKRSSVASSGENSNNNERAIL